MAQEQPRRAWVGLSHQRSRAVRRVRENLDRPGRRWLLGAIASLAVTLRYRQPCLIRWRDGAWIHHYRGAMIPHPRCAAAPPYSQFTACTHVFLHRYSPREGDVVFDVGAGVGSETLPLSRLVGPTGRVIALEAHPDTCGWLNKLCHLNGLANVVQLQVAAGAVAGELGMTDLDEHEVNRVVDGDSRLKVPGRPLDDIARALGIDRVDFVKMNIEGAERLAIEGMQELIGRTRHVCISCHDFLADDGGPQSMRTKAAVREFLVDNGFRVTSRDGATHPWSRDYVYGENTRLDEADG